MAETSRSKTSASDIEDQIKQIREDISSLSKLVIDFGGEQVSQAHKTARARAEKIAGDASQKIRANAETVEGYISEKPVQSALIALLAGFLIGSMLRR